VLHVSQLVCSFGFSRHWARDSLTCLSLYTTWKNRSSSAAATSSAKDNWSGSHSTEQMALRMTASNLWGSAQRIRSIGDLSDDECSVDGVDAFKRHAVWLSNRNAWTVCALEAIMILTCPQAVTVRSLLPVHERGTAYHLTFEHLHHHSTRLRNIWNPTSFNCLFPACRACDYVYIDYVRCSRSSSCRLLRPINCQTYITLHYKQTGCSTCRHQESWSLTHEWWYVTVMEAESYHQDS